VPPALSASPWLRTIGRPSRPKGQQAILSSLLSLLSLFSLLSSLFPLLSYLSSLSLSLSLRRFPALLGSALPCLALPCSTLCSTLIFSALLCSPLLCSALLLPPTPLPSLRDSSLSRGARSLLSPVAFEVRLHLSHLCPTCLGFRKGPARSTPARSENDARQMGSQGLDTDSKIPASRRTDALALRWPGSKREDCRSPRLGSAGLDLGSKSRAGIWPKKRGQKVSPGSALASGRQRLHTGAQEAPE
jgi:hypothetical protein